MWDEFTLKVQVEFFKHLSVHIFHYITSTCLRRKLIKPCRYLLAAILFLKFAHIYIPNTLVSVHDIQWTLAFKKLQACIAFREGVTCLLLIPSNSVPCSYDVITQKRRFQETHARNYSVVKQYQRSPSNLHFKTLLRFLNFLLYSSKLISALCP